MPTLVVESRDKAPLAEMLHFQEGMPVVFVIAEEWRLRAAVRAELRERGIKALGMETLDDAGRVIAAGEAPSVIVLDAAALNANASATSAAPLRTLLRHVPTVLIASRTISNAPALDGLFRKVLFRPVQVSEIVAAVLDLLKGQNC